MSAMAAGAVTMARHRSGSWLRAWLLGAMPPFAIAAPIAVVVRDVVNYALDRGRWPSPDAVWLTEVAGLVLLVALVALAVQGVVIAVMALAERNGPKVAPVWLLAGVIATTPLVLYMLWPNQPVHKLQVLAVYGLGMIGAAAGRRIRHGKESE